MKEFSTGCGTKIHHRASPAHRAWFLQCTAAPTVKEELGGVPRMSECGCCAVGVGCCVCGNALGVYNTFCAAHSNPASFTFLEGSVSPPVPPMRKRRITRQARTAVEPRARITATDTATTTATSEPRRDRGLSALFDAPIPATHPPTEAELRDMAEQAEAEFQEQEARRAEATALFDAVYGPRRGVRMPRTISEVDTWLTVHRPNDNPSQTSERDDAECTRSTPRTSAHSFKMAFLLPWYRYLDFLTHAAPRRLEFQTLIQTQVLCGESHLLRFCGNSRECRLPYKTTLYFGAPSSPF
ncbi:hypothetical protein B0H12DRAFT_1122812 [Mycena haematopus]|nr:hypothetical protein B0H12DRAFT_1122812 [Mycena haematopus]